MFSAGAKDNESLKKLYGRDAEAARTAHEVTSHTFPGDLVRKGTCNLSSHGAKFRVKMTSWLMMAPLHWSPAIFSF